MNLEIAIKELCKDPRPVMDTTGKVHPGRWITERYQSAVNWLRDRYNDGTLKVEGYDFQENVQAKRVETFTRRREHVVDEKTYMRLKDVVDATGMTVKTVRRLAKESGAYLSIGPSTTLIDKELFFGYLDSQRAKQRMENYMNIMKRNRSKEEE